MSVVEQEGIAIEWLYRKLENTLSAKENEEVEKWLEEPAHREYFSQLEFFYHLPEHAEVSEQEINEAWQFMNQRVARHSWQRTKKKLWAMVSVAASLVILFTSYFVWDNLSERHDDSQKMVQIRPGRQHAVLKLANGQTFDLGNWVGQKNVRIADHIVMDSGRLDYRVSTPSGLADILFNTLTVPRGGEFQITLEDGTKVWLNSDSQLRYPEIFSGHNREVYLEGEAYFEVTQNPGRPFIVHSGIQKITVLGTRFGITAYPGETSVSTTLVQGKVKVEYPELTAQNYLLEPGYRICYDSQERQVYQKKVDVREYVAWKDGKYIFEQKRLEDMLLTLSRWYDFQVLYQSPEVKELLFSGELLRFDNFNKILRMIEKSGNVKFTIEGRVVIVSK